MPERIQRRRTKGWTMPDGAVYVGRPSRWGNPFVVEPTRGGGFDVVERAIPDSRSWGTFADRAAAHRLAVDLFEVHTGHLGSYEPDNYEEWLWRLRGRDLCCWCPPGLPCHADSLIEMCRQVFGES